MSRIFLLLLLVLSFGMAQEATSTAQLNIGLDFDVSYLLRCDVPSLVAGERYDIPLGLLSRSAIAFYSEHPELGYQLTFTAPQGLALSVINTSSQTSPALIVQLALPEHADVAAISSCSAVNYAIIAVLLDHHLPTGLSYVPNSSYLNQLLALSEPQIEGRSLRWQLATPKGRLSYSVRASQAIASLALPQLTLINEFQQRLSFHTLEVSDLVNSRVERYLYQGDITAHFGESFRLSGMARVFLETPLEEGSLKLVIDRDFSEQADLSSSNDNRFPLLGTASQEAEASLTSADGIAFSYQDEGGEYGYREGRLALPALPLLPSASAFYYQGQGAEQVAIRSFAGLLPETLKEVEIIPDGTRFYSLDEAIQRDSEVVILSVAGEQQLLERGRDYTINPLNGDLTLSRTLWETSFDFEEVRLIISYAPLDSSRQQLAFGTGFQLQEGAVRLAASIAQSNRTDFGLQANYDDDDLALALSYAGNSDDGGRLRASASASEGPVAGSARVDLEDDLALEARLSYQLSPSSRLAVEHAFQQDLNASDLLYEQQVGDFSFGGGLGYIWEDAQLRGLARGAYQVQDFSLSISHVDSFDQGRESNFSSAYALSESLSLEAALQYDWSSTLTGQLGLRQALGEAQVSLGYALPDGTGGNQAQVQVDLPFSISDTLSLDFSVGYQRDLNDDSDQAAFGLAARYQLEQLSTRLQSDIAFNSEQLKWILIANASGTFWRHHSLSADVRYEVLPESSTQFTLAYALRLADISLLTYHRWINDDEKHFVGELASTFQALPQVQLRPAFAYDVALEDSDANAFQLSLGGTWYLNSRSFLDADSEEPLSFGLGSALHYLSQPNLAVSHLGVSAELSAALQENLWLTLGYTFNDFQGLTRDSQGGLYLRLELIDAGQSIDE